MSRIASGEAKVFVSQGQRAFQASIRASYGLSCKQLLQVLSNNTGTSRFRAAALRNLVACAPLEVTRGRPFLERRRLVRKHYRV